MCLARLIAGCAVVAVLTLPSSHSLSGQDKKNREGKSNVQLPVGYDKLDLTTAQTDEIIKLQKEHKEGVNKLKLEIARLDAAIVKQRLDVLTDEQRKKLRESYAEGGDKNGKEKK